MESRPKETFGLTIEGALRRYEAAGYSGSFRVASADRVQCLTCRAQVPPWSMNVHSLARIEGVSDPADETIVIGLRCPPCGTRGTLILAYGPGGGPEEAAVLHALHDQRSLAH